MVPYDAHSDPVNDIWVVPFGYIQWFYNVPHSYMIPDVAGAPPRPTHQEILEMSRLGMTTSMTCCFSVTVLRRL